MEDYYIALGKRIRNARKDSKVSQKELAQILGKKTSTYVTLIESGKRKVSIRDLVLISATLEKPLAYFIGNDHSDLESREIIKLGLRADPNLDRSQKRLLLSFYDFLKNENDFV